MNPRRQWVGVAARARALGAGRAPVGDGAVGEAAAEAAKPCRAVHHACAHAADAGHSVVCEPSVFRQYGCCLHWLLGVAMEPRVVCAVGVAARARTLGLAAPVGDGAAEAAAALGLEAAKPCRAVPRMFAPQAQVTALSAEPSVFRQYGCGLHWLLEASQWNPVSSVQSESPHAHAPSGLPRSCRRPSSWRSGSGSTEAAKLCRAVHDAVCLPGSLQTQLSPGARTRVRAGHIKLQRSALKITSSGS